MKKRDETIRKRDANCRDAKLELEWGSTVSLRVCDSGHLHSDRRLCECPLGRSRTGRPHAFTLNRREKKDTQKRRLIEAVQGLHR